MTTTSATPPRPLVGRRSAVGGLRARGVLRLRRADEERQRGLGRLFGLVVLGGGIALFILVVTFAGGFFVRLREAEELSRAAVGVALLGMVSALVLSSLGHAATAFFAAQDLWFWDAAPVPTLSRFVDRVSETALGAVPATLVLGALAIAGFLLGVGTGPFALSRALVTVGLVAALPVGIGVSVAHLGGALLPAGRLRRLSLVLLGVATFFVLAWLRSARLEEVVTAEGAARLLDSARSLEEIGAWWWPHNLGSRFILDGDLAALGGLLGWSSLTLGVAFALHHFLYVRCRDLAADESPEGLRRGSLAERVLFWLVGRLPQDLRPVALKDVLAFVRDASQWSQLLLLIGIAAIYAVNCRALVTGFEGLIFVQEVVLVAVHVGIVTFISAGLAARFAFPQAGLEGFAVWMVEASPLPARRLLLAKWWATLPVVALFPVLVAVVGALVFGWSPSVFVLSTGTVLLTSAGLVALGVGRGAISPVLDAVSVAELSMGPGALSTMATAVALCGVASGATFVSCSWLMFRGDGLSGTTVAFLLSWIPSGLVLLYGLSTLKKGADAFEQRKEIGTAGAPVVVQKRRPGSSRDSDGPELKEAGA